jgi:hypothetical protein
MNSHQNDRSGSVANLHRFLDYFFMKKRKKSKISPYSRWKMELTAMSSQASLPEERVNLAFEK